MKKTLNKSITSKKIIALKSGKHTTITDVLAIEEPIEITLDIPLANPPVRNKNLSITMRTPGQDIDLALGFLFTEGILASIDQINDTLLGENVITVEVNTSQAIDLSKIERHFYTSSSCGVCGKSSIDAIKTECRLTKRIHDIKINKDLITIFPEKLRQEQAVFNVTGGLHAAAIFSVHGDFIMLREDVGRHNALDKLIGAAFQNNKLPLDKHLLLLSGRASFELIQKAAMAGIQFVMAVGAPSSLAVSLAEEFDITLIGFLRKEGYNIYTGEKRILFE